MIIEIFSIFAKNRFEMVKSQKQYIDALRSHADTLKSDFGVKSLRIFGSVARNTQTEGSDIDLCVDMPPKMLQVCKLKDYLEDLLKTSVDIIRFHPHINPYLKEEIDRDGLLVF